MAEITSSARDSRLPLPPEERCGHSYHFINCFLDFVEESLDEFGVCDSVHESRDSHAFWCSFDIPAFQLISFHEIFRRFSIPLLDVMEFYRIFDAFLLLKVSQILGFPSISLGLVNGSKWAPCLARVRGNRDLRTWNPFRGCGIPSAEGLRRPLMASYVHFATSGPRQRRTGLSSGPLCFLIVLLGMGPRKAYVVQARKPALRNIRHQSPTIAMK
ncbi:hypothetical protein Tco_0898276 [Tanacetum coccineum]